jgi:Ca2+-transporting ATPase
MFGGVLLAGPLGVPRDGGGVALPQLAAQILWINLVTDGAPAFALGVDPAGEDLMRARPRPARERANPARMWRDIASTGAVMAAGTLLVLDAALPGGFLEGSGSLRRAQTMAFTTLMLFQLFNVLESRSEERSAFSRPFSNPWVWLAILVSLALQVAVLEIPALQRAFGVQGRELKLSVVSKGQSPRMVTVKW